MTDWNEHEDAISDGISDSIDMDWTSRTGAKAVVAWLNENVPDPSLLDNQYVLGGECDVSDVRYGLHLIANEDCDEVAAAFYAKAAIAHINAMRSSVRQENPA